MKKILDILKQPVHQFNKDIRIGIWGTMGSGKTTYICRLYMELLKSKKWLFAFNPDQKDAEEYINKLVDEFEKGYFPEPTEPGKDTIKVYDFIIRGQYFPFLGTNVVISFVDAPGEFYENTNSGKYTIKNQAGERIDILTYLLGCHGIIFLLDPETTIKPESKTLSSIFRRLMPKFQESYQRYFKRNEKAKLQQYMAFCINKVDRKDFREAAEKPQIWAEKLMGSIVYESLNTLCINDRYKFFGVSPIGESALISENKVNSDSPDDQEENNISAQEKPKSPIFGTPISSGTSEGRTGRLSSSADREEFPPALPQKQFNSEKEPIKIIEPFEWLIESIRKNPPDLPNLETDSKNKS